MGSTLRYLIKQERPFRFFLLGTFYLLGDNTEGQLLDLKEMMQDYAMMEQDLQQYVRTVKQVKGQVSS